MEKMNDLKALLQHEVHDLVSAEEQIIEAMPLMIESAGNPSLKAALQEHLAVTEKQRERLDKVNGLLSKDGSEGEKGFLSELFSAISGGGEKCRGMEGIITEGQKIIKADMDADVKDAAIIACAQKIEHYEICGYGTLTAYARQLDLKEVESLLQQTLEEEYAADDKLTQLAVGGINERAEERGSRQKPAKKSNSASKPADAAPKEKITPAKKTAAKKAAAPQGGLATPKKAAPKKEQPKKAAAKSTNEPKVAPKKAAPKKAGAKK